MEMIPSPLDSGGIPILLKALYPTTSLPGLIRGIEMLNPDPVHLKNHMDRENGRFVDFEEQQRHFVNTVNPK
jgi:hypothetical protein